MKKQLVVSHVARSDLRNISAYGKREWGETRNRLYLNAIRDRLKELTRTPALGPLRPEVAEGYRSVLVGRHVTFYRVEERRIIILRVLHQRMDLSSHIGEERSRK